MKAFTWLVLMIAFSLCAIGGMVVIVHEKTPTLAMVSEQTQRQGAILETVLLASTGSRQTLVNNANADAIASWNFDTCLPYERIEPEVIRARLRQDANDCDEAWSGIRRVRANAAQAPSAPALANAARVLAQQCVVSAQTTQVMIAQHIAQAAGCETSPTGSLAPKGKIVAPPRPL